MRSLVKKSLLMTGLLAFVCLASVFAGGTPEKTQVQVQPLGSQYFNPLSGGAKSSVTLSFTVQIPTKGDSGYVPEYGLTVEDSSGAVVRTVSEKEPSTVGFFASLFGGYKTYTLTKTLTWDGKDDKGNVVPDGDYKPTLYVIDTKGQKVTTPLGDFFVVTKPPVVTLSAPNGLIFNPSIQGTLATFQVSQQNGTPEPLWTGTFTDSTDKVVRTYTWQNSAPQSFGWDGKDDGGNQLPDGLYGYHVSSTDPAGNQSQNYGIANIALNTVKTAVTLSLDNPYISPNGDGIKDTTTATITASTNEPVVSWDLALLDPKGATARDVGGKGPFPPKLPFDGKDSSGNALPNAAYTAKFSAVFDNGDQESATAPLVVNTAPPAVSIALNNDVFSPTAASAKPTTTATLTVTPTVPVPVDSWDLAVYSSSGTIVRELKGAAPPPAQVSYDGKDSSGAVVPDGAYTAKYTVTTADGLSASASAPFAIDTVPPKVSIAVSAPIFTPKTDDANNTEVISITSDKPVTWTGTISDASGQTLLSAQQPMSVTSVTLDKNTPQIASARDGVYKLNLTFEDKAGNETTAEPVAITLLTSPIAASIQVPAGFSPKAAPGHRTLDATITSTVADRVSTWDIAVLDSTGNSIADYPGTGALPSQFQWNGATGPRGQSGVNAPDGTYTLRLSATVGTLSGQTVSNQFVIDTVQPEVTLAVTPGAFALSDAGVTGTASVTIQATSPSGTIASWTADVLAPRGNVVKTISADGNPTQSGTWQGSLPSPAPAPQSAATLDYSVRLSVLDPYFNEASAVVKAPIDVIGRLVDGKIHLLEPNIQFGAYSAGLASRSAAEGRRNYAVLRQVARILADHPEFTLELDGYSMEVYKPTARLYEHEENIIVPLTKSRALAVRNALVRLGADPARLVTRFWGGMNPLVDPLNERTRWLNRRVEFVVLPAGTQPPAEPSDLEQRIK